MSAATLREAAAKMRALATGLPVAPWSVAPGPGVKDAAGVKVASVALDTIPRTRTPIAAYIAAMSPPVALAVAASLEAAAAVIEEAGDGPLALVAAGLAEPSIATARAFLNP